jgi:ABC-type lipoprotein export system ATPase subunit
MSKSALVKLRSVSKTYGGKRGTVALRGASLEIGQGHLACLVGPSGSGKTTLLNLIALLDRPDQGDIVVDGIDVTRLSLRDAAAYRRDRIGIVFQSYNLIPQLTALDNILLPMIAKRRPDRQRAAELLDVIGLADRHNYKPPQLSGGEQQRVAIARALANDPALVLADEPTGNLDDETARIVLDLLRRSCQERGTTLILVTHDRAGIGFAEMTFELRRGSLTRVDNAPARHL